MKIQLYTSDGVGVVTGPLLIPEFNQFPDVIFWGTRSFVVDAKASLSGTGVYVEAFAYALPDDLRPLSAKALEAMASDGS